MDPYILSDNEKNKRLLLGRSSKPTNYHTNEIINIKNLKSQFRLRTYFRNC